MLTMRLFLFVLFHLCNFQGTWANNENPIKLRRAFVLAPSFRRLQKSNDKHHQLQLFGFFFGSSSKGETYIDDDNNALVGHVVRLAARSYDPVHSKPSSREYTTRKIEQSSVQIYWHGVSNDYNHYRTVALKSTLNRAVSILTTDCLEYIKAYQYPVCDGDLGENILVHGLYYSYFQIGARYAFIGGNSKSTITSQHVDDDDDVADDNVVVLEITEPMIPCANLCKLSYINNEQKTPKERIATCQHFLNLLDKESGLRGWYAKVIQEGRIECGAKVQRIKVKQQQQNGIT